MSEMFCAGKLGRATQGRATQAEPFRAEPPRAEPPRAEPPRAEPHMQTIKHALTSVISLRTYITLL